MEKNNESEKKQNPDRIENLAGLLEKLMGTDRSKSRKIAELMDKDESAAATLLQKSTAEYTTVTEGASVVVDVRKPDGGYTIFAGLSDNPINKDKKPSPQKKIKSNKKEDGKEKSFKGLQRGFLK